jgi:hypothetical protein
MFKVDHLRNDTLNSFRYSGVSLKYRFLILPNIGYYLRNELNIVTNSLCLDTINPNNQKRLNRIWELYLNGYSCKDISVILNKEGYKRRNTKKEYSYKDVWVCIDKLKKREKRKTDIRYNIGLWELCLDIGG